MNLKKIKATQEIVSALKGMAGALSRLNSTVKDWQTQGYLPREGQEKPDDMIVQGDIDFTVEEKAILDQFTDNGGGMMPGIPFMQTFKVTQKIDDVYKSLAMLQQVAAPASEEKAGEIPLTVLIERL